MPTCRLLSFRTPFNLMAVLLIQRQSNDNFTSSETSRHLTIIHSNYSTVNQTITNDSKTQYYTKHWKPAWSRAVKVSPPVCKSSDTANSHIDRTQADVLRRIFTLSCTLDEVDTRVVAFRSRTCFGPKDFTAMLQITQKKVDLYGVTLHNLFLDPDFTSLLLEHLASTGVKFRILIKDPTTGMDELSQLKWSNYEHLGDTLKALYALREQSSDKQNFDSKCQIRLHNAVNYFTYYRFDEMIAISHHLGPQQSSTNSFFHQHWRSSSSKDSSNSSSWKDFAKIFRSVWDAAVPLVEGPNHVCIRSFEVIHFARLSPRSTRHSKSCSMSPRKRSRMHLSWLRCWQTATRTF